MYIQGGNKMSKKEKKHSYGIHGQAILIAGYPSADIPMEWLKKGLKDND